MVSVVYPALNFAYHRLPEAESIRRVKLMRIGDGERFVLHVGASAWYKNQTGLVRIFQRLITYSQTADLTLVMVCSGLSPSVKRLIEEGHLQSKVRVISDIEPEDLRALYSSATALLFPSVYEGFGWPIIEAQACGCPVFTSNRPPMTEVGGQGAIYFDPEDPSEAAQIILENLPHASRMREAGFSNVKRFSTANMIAGYLRAYREAITATSARRLNEIRAAEGFRGG
jgi:glycosyltransferase involved in cell wall biosynthesis